MSALLLSKSSMYYKNNTVHTKYGMKSDTLASVSFGPSSSVQPRWWLWGGLNNKNTVKSSPLSLLSNIIIDNWLIGAPVYDV